MGHDSVASLKQAIEIMDVSMANCISCGIFAIAASAQSDIDRNRTASAADKA